MIFFVSLENLLKNAGLAKNCTLKDLYEHSGIDLNLFTISPILLFIVYLCYTPLIVTRVHLFLALN